MEIEVQEFYPVKKKYPKQNFIGTMHIYLCDENMDIKGIRVCRAGRNYFVEVPFAYGADDDGEIVKYPFLTFLDNDKQADFISSMRREAKKFLDAYYKKERAKNSPLQPQKQKELIKS